MLSATPAVSLGLSSQSLIGHNISFTAAFSNASPSTTGYGPYIDLVFPNNGAQDPLPNGATQDGISFANATYLGQPVTSYVLTFPAGPGGARRGR